MASACDGLTNLDDATGYLQQIILLNPLIKAGLAEECEPKDAINPWQFYRQAANPYVRSVHWSITGKCNLKCRHCYVEAPDSRYGELPLPDILRIIDQLAAANVHGVELTGGEPLLRRDLPDILTALAKQQIAVRQIYSNGILITPEILRTIKEQGFTPRFQISFDGCGTHDAMRGVSGAEAPTLQAIRFLREHDVPVIVATCIDRNNLGALPATYEMMKELGIQYWRIAPPQAIGNWRQSKAGLTLEAALPVCASVAKRWHEDGRPFRLQMPGYRSDEESPATYTPESYDCMVGRETPSLLPDGTLLPCPAYTDTAISGQMPNLLRESFGEIWTESALRELLNTKKSAVLAQNSECDACEHFAGCGGGCRASAVSATGELMSVDPEVCRMYQTNYRRRFSELVGL
jgi:radical SAM protein with 4Fe4S-binding SPASM domain